MVTRVSSKISSSCFPRYSRFTLHFLTGTVSLKGSRGRDHDDRLDRIHPIDLVAEMYRSTFALIVWLSAALSQWYASALLMDSFQGDNASTIDVDSSDEASVSDVGLLLTGWHTNVAEDGLECRGNLIPVLSPKPLDTSGRTCYVNPVADDTILPGVIWYAPVTDREGYEGVYAWSVIFRKGSNYSDFMPAGCMSGRPGAGGGNLPMPDVPVDGR